jgi:hypothetical protein
MITSIKFKAGELRRLLSNAILFASKDDTLPVLVTVRFDWDGDRLFTVATNRCIISWEEALPVEAKGRPVFSVAVRDAKQIIALLPTGKNSHPWQEVDVEYDDDARKAQFAFEGNTVMVSTDHGDFPRWRTLRGAFTGSARDGITFDPKLLALFAKVDGGSKLARVRLSFQEGNKPARAEIGEHFSALIMPISGAG